MKRTPNFLTVLFYFFISLSSVPCFASNYYVDATGGNDSNPGTSEGLAWETMGKLNSVTLKAGDRVLFKRGEAWTGSDSTEWNLLTDGTQSQSQPITIGAYGDGDRPILDGDASAQHIIDVTGGDDWIVFENLDLRSSRAAVLRIVNGTSDNITIDNCVLRDSTDSHGIYWDGTNLTLKNSTLKNNGVSGGDHAIYLDNCSGNASNALIEYNVFDKHPGGTIKINSCNVGRISGIVIRYNQIHDDKWILIDDYASDGAEIYYNVLFGSSVVHDGPVMIFSSNAGTYHARNAKIYNNTIHHTPRTGYYAIQINSGSTGHVIKNNIFYSGPGTGGYILANATGGISECDYNNYYGGNVRWRYGANIYTTLVGWRGAGFDAHSVLSDPKFLDAGTHNYNLESDSPGKDAGTPLGLTEDYAGSPVPYDGGVDMGAYEYIGALAAPNNLRIVTID